MTYSQMMALLCRAQELFPPPHYRVGQAWVNAYGSPKGCSAFPELFYCTNPGKAKGIILSNYEVGGCGNCEIPGLIPDGMDRDDCKVCGGFGFTLTNEE